MRCLKTLNVSFYQFTPLEAPELWKPILEQELRAKGLKGTVLLAQEGMNGFLSGLEQDVQAALSWLRSQPAFENLWAKESFSEGVPFRRLKVKVKKEIVTFRVPNLSLETHAAPRISPAELKTWLDQSKDFLLIDTRNEYEVRIGTFEKALSLNVNRFVDFAQKIQDRLPEWKDKEIVTFCTGGIRCEKAAPYMKSLGFEKVYQLDGGILNYFEKEKDAHWKGECFVFDDRVGVKKNLAPSGSTLCVHCQWPNPQNTPACLHCGK